MSSGHMQTANAQTDNTFAVRLQNHWISVQARSLTLSDSAISLAVLDVSNI